MAAIALDGPFAALSGAGHGLVQPVMLGALLVRTPCDADFDALDAIFSPALGEAPPASADAAPTPLRLAARVLFWVDLLQRRAGIPVFSPARVLGQEAGPHEGCVRLRVVAAYAYPAPVYFLVALRGVVGLLVAWIDGLPGTAPGRPSADAVSAQLAELQNALRHYAPPGVNAFRFVKAAHALGIPFHWLAGSIFTFGQGRHARWLDSALTDTTPALGSLVARQKMWTSQVLKTHGFPVARHQAVPNAEDAVKVAHALGYPVVVKPADQDGGVGVAAGLRDADAVRAAYAQARQHSAQVLVEEHVEGRDYRMTVVEGCLVKTVWRVPGGVIGDGRQSVAELVVQTNRSPDHARRNRERGRTLLDLDAEALDLLREQSLAPTSVPEAGAFVRLRRRANISTGGASLLVDEQVHPDNRRLAERVARTLRLDVAGVDLILPDIARSWTQGGAIVCEVNAKPQIGEGTTPQVYGEILTRLLGGDGRLPIALLVGGAAASALGRALCAELAGAGHVVGLAAADGGWVGDECVALAGQGAHAAALAVMSDRQTEVAVIVAQASDLLRTGLPFDRCDAMVLAEAADLAPAQWWPLVVPHVARAVVFTEDALGPEGAAARAMLPTLSPATPCPVSLPAPSGDVQAYRHLVRACLPWLTLAPQPTRLAEGTP